MQERFSKWVETKVLNAGDHLMNLGLRVVRREERIARKQGKFDQAVAVQGLGDQLEAQRTLVSTLRAEIAC